MSIRRIGTTARFSDAVIYNGVANIVEVPTSENTDITTQTREMLESLERRLALAGSDKTKLLSATIYLTDMADYAGLNEVWEAWVPAGCAPSRACLQVSALAKPGWKVEIVVTAAVTGTNIG